MKKIGIIIVIIFLALLAFSQKLEGYIFKRESIGRVLVVDNSNAIVQGVSKVGSQALTVEVLTGKNKGKVLEINNLLNGSMEYDEFYEKDDKVLMYVMENDGKLAGKVLSLLRIDKIIGLGLIFITLLLVYARKVGFQSLLSFVGSVVIIWEFLIPALKEGENIFLITIITLILLSALIIFLVAGFTRKGFTAFLGTMSGLFTTASLTFLFGDIFRIDGMSQPFAQSVIFASAMKIDILKIFYAAIVIGASGAAMDIAMDMSATIEELKYHNPNLNRRELVKSGFNVGRSVIGNYDNYTFISLFRWIFNSYDTIFRKRYDTFTNLEYEDDNFRDYQDNHRKYWISCSSTNDNIYRGFYLFIRREKNSKNKREDFFEKSC